MWTPHPVKVTIRDSRDCIRVLLYSYHTTITGWGVLLRFRVWGSGQALAWMEHMGVAPKGSGEGGHRGYVGDI